MKTDNRWNTGILDTYVPEGADAAYGARWIDQGDFVRADVVPDRQGFAYDDPADRERLIEMLGKADAVKLHQDIPRDEVRLVADLPEGQIWMRRAGGYVYVAAWLS